MITVQQSQPFMPTPMAPYPSPIIGRRGERALTSTPFPPMPTTIPPGPMPTPFLPHPNRHFPSTSTLTSTGTESSYSPVPLAPPQRDNLRHTARRIAVDEVDMKAQEPGRFELRLGHRNTDFGPKELDLDRSLGMGSPYNIGISTPNSKNLNVAFSRLPPDHIPTSPDPEAGVGSPLTFKSRRRASSLTSGRGRVLQDELPRGRHHHDYDYDGDRDLALTVTRTPSTSRHRRRHRSTVLDTGNGAIHIPSSGTTVVSGGGIVPSPNLIPNPGLGHGYTFVATQPAGAGVTPIPTPITPQPTVVVVGGRSRSESRSRRHHRHRSPSQSHSEHRSQRSAHHRHQLGQPLVSISQSTTAAPITARPVYTRRRSRSLGALPAGTAPGMSDPRVPVYTTQPPLSLPSASAPIHGQMQNMMPGPGPGPGIPYNLTNYPYQPGRYTSMQQGYSGVYSGGAGTAYGYGTTGTGIASGTSVPKPPASEQGFFSRLFGQNKSTPGAGPGLAAGIGSGKSARFAPQPPGYPQTQMQTQMNYPQTQQMPMPMPMQSYGGMGTEGHRHGFGGSWGLRHHHQPVASIPPPPPQGPLPTRRARRRRSF